jgi:rod shape-determining protein MreD
LNWVVFLVVGWVAFGLELGLRDALRLAPGDVAPSFVVPVMVYVALSAPSKQALWAAILLGALVDVTWIIPRTDAAATASVLGPYALGMLVAAQFVLAVRGLVIRRHPLTLTVLSMIASIIASVVVVAFLTVRSLYGDPIEFSPTSDLGSRLLSGLYTGATALGWAFALRLVDPFFGFHHDRGVRRH